jgi:hypothetical protein
MKRGNDEMKEMLFSEDEKQYTHDGDISITRKQTTIEREVRSRLDSAHALSTSLISHEDLAKHEVEQYMPPVSAVESSSLTPSPQSVYLFISKSNLSNHYQLPSPDL